MKAKINVIKWPSGHGLELETDKTNFAFAGKCGGGEGKVAMSFTLEPSLTRELLEELRRVVDTPADESDFSVIATSKLAGVEIADRDYCEGDKKHFTFEEASELENKLSNGWRLPTRKEWALICEEFGCGKHGSLEASLLIAKLDLGLNGRYSDNTLVCSGAYGYYWSSSSDNSTSGYRLLLSSGNGAVSQGSNYKRYGYSVRCVRDINWRRDNERD